MHLQQGIEGYDRFVRCIGLGPQFLQVSYNPSAALHDRYQIEHQFLEDEDRQLLEDMTMTINSFFGWDFNSCEALRRGDTWYPIDFANACPDSQVTSLHYHFPWMIMANIRWAVFCAATRKKMAQNLNWQPYYDILAEDLPYRERLRAYAAVGHERMQTERFQAFCKEHLSQVEEVVWEYFGSPAARDAVAEKVKSLYPPHEVESFTQLFWDRIQLWRHETRDALV
jgi:hypothetical protein